MRHRKITTAGAAAVLAAAAWLTLPVSQAGAAVPQSAYGCNLNTCIEIDGSGTTVTAIFGQTRNPGSNSIKTTGTVYDNNVSIHTFPQVTLAPGGTITQEWASPGYHFRSGDQVCVKYSGIAGQPCETIG